MVIPTAIIMPLFLVAFVLTGYQYYHVDPKRRVLNLRFAIMSVTIIGAVTYPLVSYLYGTETRLPTLSQGYATTALLCLAVACVLLRRMPPAEHY